MYFTRSTTTATTTAMATDRLGNTSALSSNESVSFQSSRTITESSIAMSASIFSNVDNNNNTRQDRATNQRHYSFHDHDSRKSDTMKDFKSIRSHIFIHLTFLDILYFSIQLYFHDVSQSIYLLPTQTVTLMRTMTVSHFKFTESYYDVVMFGRNRFDGVVRLLQQKNRLRKGESYYYYNKNAQCMAGSNKVYI